MQKLFCILFISIVQVCILLLASLQVMSCVGYFHLLYPHYGLLLLFNCVHCVLNSPAAGVSIMNTWDVLDLISIIIIQVYFVNTKWVFSMDLVWTFTKPLNIISLAILLHHLRRLRGVVGHQSHLTVSSLQTLILNLWYVASGYI